MRITKVEPICLRVPAWDEGCEWGDDAFLVRIHTDEGIVGIGESDTSPTVARAMIEAPESNLHCTGLERLLLGGDPMQVQDLWDKMYWQSNYVGRRGLGIHAMSAVDIALWDIVGQYLGVPVKELLGGACKDHIDVYGTFIPSDSMAENRRIVRKLLDSGYTSLKFGGGALGDDEDLDVEIIRTVRQEAGDQIQIQIDLATKWRSYDHAARMMRRVEPFNLAWAEEPIPSDDFSQVKRLAQLGIAPISGGEDLTTRYEFRPFIEQSGVSIVQPDITRCGGISEIRRIGLIAENAGVRLIPHGFSTGILLAATMHFLSATPGADLMEYSQSESPLFRKLVKNMPVPKCGRISLPQEPGLGIVVDDDMIEQYRI